MFPDGYGNNTPTPVENGTSGKSVRSLKAGRFMIRRPWIKWPVFNKNSELWGVNLPCKIESMIA